MAPAWAEEAPRVLGPPVTVFDWATARCEDWDIPDTPTRAWRGWDGTVHVVAGSERSRASTGSGLGLLARDCKVLYRGAGANDPAAYDDRVWLHATYAAGARVIALGHEEYHGHLRRERCPTGVYVQCWRNAIVELESNDDAGGFDREGTRVVAALPYRYSGDAGHRTGYYKPSNILRLGDDLYVFVMAEQYGAQRRGPCLLRRPIGGGAADWRAWDGAGFNVRFIDPYREDMADPARHVCAPVGNLQSTISSVVESTATGRYLAVTSATRTGPEGVARSGIYWMSSADLLDWTEPALLWQVPLLWRRDCAAPAVYAYPSLLDPDSTSPNFETVDESFWLYIVEIPLRKDCAVGAERDLVRLLVSWPEP